MFMLWSVQVEGRFSLLLDSFMNSLHLNSFFEGTPPQFDNLPTTASVAYDATVGTKVFTLKYSDRNKKDVLAVTLVSISPETAKFTFDATSGGNNNHLISHHIE